MALGVAEVALIVGSAVALALWPQSPGSSNIIVAAAAWFIGDSIRARRIYVQGIAEQAAARLRDESERAERALADQRTEIARELHDVVAHGMSVIAVQAGVGRHVINDRPDEAAKALEAIQVTSRLALGDLRRVLALLRRDGDQEPANLEPSPGLRELPSLLEQVRSAGVAVQMEVKGKAVGLPQGMDLTAYRIVQEALTNVVKHAGGATASVLVEYTPDSLVIEVADSGNGSGEGGDTGRLGALFCRRPPRSGRHARAGRALRRNARTAVHPRCRPTRSAHHCPWPRWRHDHQGAGGRRSGSCACRLPGPGGERSRHGGCGGGGRRPRSDRAGPGRPGPM